MIIIKVKLLLLDFKLNRLKRKYNKLTEQFVKEYLGI